MYLYFYKQNTYNLTFNQTSSNIRGNISWESDQCPLCESYSNLFWRKYNAGLEEGEKLLKILNCILPEVFMWEL